MPDSFARVADRRAAALWVDAQDWAGVVRAAGDLRDDIERVTGVDPAAVVQKIVVHDADRALPASYPGPPESYRH